jgi:dTDP-4-dehydrorhamnose reductase
MKKILITGSNGLLGQKLTELLVKNPSVQVIATARGENRLPFSSGYTFETMDITNNADVNRVIGTHRPDVVINTAAMTNVDQCESEKDACWAQNVTAVEYIINACKETEAFLLHVSTDFIFDGEAGPYSEDAEPNPVSFYGWSKFAAEKAVQHSGSRWAIARTVLVYGIVNDMSRSNIILWVKNSLENKKDIKVVNDQWRTPTLAEDLAQGCWLIAHKEEEGIFNISGEDFLNPYQMAVQTAEFFNLDKNFIHEVDGSIFSQTAKRPPKTGFDISKAKHVLGYKPVSFKEGIAILASQMPSS